MTGKVPVHQKDLSVDTSALAQGYVTLTPIACNLTHAHALEQLRAWRFKI